MNKTGDRPKMYLYKCSCSDGYCSDEIKWTIIIKMHSGLNLNYIPSSDTHFRFNEQWKTAADHYNDLNMYTTNVGMQCTWWVRLMSQWTYQSTIVTCMCRKHNTFNNSLLRVYNVYTGEN